MSPDGAHLAVAFCRVLRGAGVAVPVGAATTYAEALAAVGVDRRNTTYWAGRATLVHRPEDAALYDAAFASFWEGLPGVPRPPSSAPAPPIVLAVDDDTLPDGDGAPEPGQVLAMRYSAAEVLRHKDFAAYGDDELHEAHRLMAGLALAGPRRRSRRHRPAAGARGRPDLRRTVRRSLRTGGEVVRPARRLPATRPRRIVVLVDVSGSMEAYARALLRFAHVAVSGRAGRRVEAFTLGTRLTRLTRELSSRDPDAALAAAAAAVPDWSGGTRLGEALRRFNDEWGVRGMARGAVVIVLSDGWDRGEPTLLGEQMARLRRVAHQVVWVNPLKASDGYAPLAGGMAAALPHVDTFMAGHSLASLESLAQVLNR